MAVAVGPYAPPGKGDYSAKTLGRMELQMRLVVLQQVAACAAKGGRKTAARPGIPPRTRVGEGTIKPMPWNLC